MPSVEEALMAWNILEIQRKRNPLGSSLHPKAVPQNQEEFLPLKVKRSHFEREAISTVIFLVAKKNPNSLKKGLSLISHLARTVGAEGEGNHHRQRIITSCSKQGV